MSRIIQSTTALQIQRMPTVSNQTGLSRSAIYRRAKANLFPKPFDIGGGRVGWLASEVEAMIRARVNGKSDDEIKQLVAKLEAMRGSL